MVDNSKNVTREEIARRLGVNADDLKTLDAERVREAHDAILAERRTLPLPFGEAAQK